MARGRNPYRSVAHEALHVAMDLRGERLYGIAEAYPGAGPAACHALALAGILIEEYRVDRALWDTGLAPGAREIGQFDEDISALARDCAAAWAEVEAGQLSPTGFLEILQSTFGKLTYLAAGTCALDIASGGADPPARTQPVWNRLVGVFYDRIRELLQPPPRAATAVPHEELEGAVIRLAPNIVACSEYFVWPIVDGPVTLRTDWELPRL